ncbi:MAG: sulfatase-like hydrolase/transferase [Pseudomonadota bacterium]
MNHLTHIRRRTVAGLLGPLALAGAGAGLAGWTLLLPGPLLIAPTLWVLLLIVQSLRHFSRSGPQLQEEILAHNLLYSIYALLRLAAWAWLISAAMALVGISFLRALAFALDWRVTPALGLGFAFLGILALSAFQFCRQLLHIPASIEASSNYRMSRFYRLWSLLTPARLHRAGWALLLLYAGVALAGTASLLLAGQHGSGAGLALLHLAVLSHFLFWRRDGEPAPARAPSDMQRPNILLIGVDSLRHDRVNSGRGLTPHADALAAKGFHFTRCYVPCARTAPSLASLLCSNWPQDHGIRDNFATPDEAKLDGLPLPAHLAQQGYDTVAISDWCGSDLGKFPFGFNTVDLPEDQWNIRYLLRQGPKDLRLFLSLFTHNDFGRVFLPEIHFLAGIPMTRQLGLATRRAISGMARKGGQPFFINTFFSSTHAPFGSEHPYYVRFADGAYQGACKFVMGGLTEPFEVVQRQGQGKAFFDYEQILKLYDGCVQSFDDELQRILDHLAACGLADNTIVVLYSDHGMEFFERETWGQGNSVIVDEGARIPFVLHDPRVPGGQCIDAVTRSIDIAPTLLDLAGLPIPPAMQGVSLRTAMADPQAAPSLSAYSETGVWFTRVPSLEAEHVTYPDLPDLLEIPDKGKGDITLKPHCKGLVVAAKDRMLCTDRWKLVRQPMRHGVEYKLFDLRNDPECWHDVAAGHAEVLGEMRERLEAMVAADPDLRAGTAAVECRP